MKVNPGIQWGLPALLAAMVAGSPGAAQQADAGAVERALRGAPEATVHDLGRLLKSGGIKELDAVGAEYRGAGRRLRIVTLPKGTGNLPDLAAQVYQKLGYGTQDTLVLFNGTQTAARARALQGRSDAFQAALAGSRDGFRRYYAAGLASFSRSLLASMNAAPERTRSAVAPSRAVPIVVETSSRPSRGISLLGWVLAVAVIFGIGYVIVVANRNRVDGPSYGERLRAAENVYQRVTLNLPDPAPAALQSEWLSLDERLDRCRSRKGRNMAQVLDLTADLEAFERKVRKSEEV